MAIDPQLLLKGSGTYLPGIMSPEPYDPALDTAVDPRDVDPSWRDDPDVDLDFMALDLSLFTEDDIFESPDYWDELLGRALNKIVRRRLGKASPKPPPCALPPHQPRCCHLD